jgi:hypothetical protein
MIGNNAFPSFFFIMSLATNSCHIHDITKFSLVSSDYEPDLCLPDVSWTDDAWSSIATYGEISISCFRNCLLVLGVLLSHKTTSTSRSSRKIRSMKFKFFSECRKVVKLLSTNGSKRNITTFTDQTSTRTVNYSSFSLLLKIAWKLRSTAFRTCLKTIRQLRFVTWILNKPREDSIFSFCSVSKGKPCDRADHQPK